MSETLKPSVVDLGGFEGDEWTEMVESESEVEVGAVKDLGSVEWFRRIHGLNGTDAEAAELLINYGAYLLTSPTNNQ